MNIEAGGSKRVDRPASHQVRSKDARCVFSGVIFKVWQWEESLADGRKVTFEQLTRPDTVLVLPVSDSGDLYLAEEKQPGIKMMLHAIGGRVDPGEDVTNAARRELLEESGLEASELRLWDAWQPSVKIDWAVYLFVAHGLKLHGTPIIDASEVIRLRRISRAELLSPNSQFFIEDYELMHKLYYARSNDSERMRVLKILEP